MAEETVEYMLTTVDNPFNPFTNFSEWYTYDMSLGYNTMGFLARVAAVPMNLSQYDRDKAIGDAIEEIARENVSGVHRKVAREDFESSLVS